MYAHLHFTTYVACVEPSASKVEPEYEEERKTGTGRADVPFLLWRLKGAINGRVQVTGDGLRLYTNNVPLELGGRVDFAQLIKARENGSERILTAKKWG